MDFVYIITRPGVITLIVLAIAIIYALYFKPVKKEEAAQLSEKDLRPAALLDLNDEDATVACLIASIDYYEKIKRDVRIISVRRVG
ncbi:MAG: hypothetical protein ACOX1F_06935 [Erysipelotrichaceae bacterium]|jgi:hypothetical protein